MSTTTRTIAANLGEAAISGIGYTIKDADNQVLQARTTSGIVDFGGGAYGVKIAWNDAWLTGFVIWDDAATGYTFRVAGAFDFNPVATTGGGGGSGTGARTVTITVKDASNNNLQNATVRMTNGLQSYTATTNASGVCTFNLDDATWTVSITKANYSFAGTTLVVDGTEAQTYTMSPVVITPAADPDQTTAYLTTRDGKGNAVGNVAVTFKMVRGPGTDGHSFDGTPFDVHSDGDGLLQVELARLSKYIITRADGFQREVTTPDASTYAIPETLGLTS